MKKKRPSKADQYNDPTFNYLDYWTGREYEHASEELAIRRLLKNRHFRRAVDVGGGYGRLSAILTEYADDVTLAEPSKQQLAMAKKFLEQYPDIHQKLMSANKLDFPDGSVDLVTMVRVMHHLPDPTAEFKELRRIIADEGLIILEVANYAHARNRIKHILKIKRFPKLPVDIRSEKNRTDKEIPFVNHNPHTVIKQLAHAGLRVQKVLSVSNLRSPRLKKVVPKAVLLTAEKLLQPPLARTYFGPSIFFLVRKA